MEYFFGVEPSQQRCAFAAALSLRSSVVPSQQRYDLAAALRPRSSVTTSQQRYDLAAALRPRSGVTTSQQRCDSLLRGLLYAISLPSCVRVLCMGKKLCARAKY
ncbi:hypothetical protein POVWA2_009270 [Plasmodium ovale wallikeri]|uniref:Uncharacterized protein n=1 Tax=Plasmodium ovale wallikeri TaxID=864142 RepID=A0A1A8YLJ9_PLAOA|nr:hypothetical protein POVWA2_009270 [Plasmodium ovale wallikeri]